MIPRTSCEVNRNGWGVCERPLKLHLSRKGLSGKAKAKTGIGKSDLPGLQGGPRKRDFVFSRQSARASALSRLRSESSRQAGSECCHSPGDWWVRSVHSKEVGREGSAPKTFLVATSTPLAWGKAVSGCPLGRG